VSTMILAMPARLLQATTHRTPGQHFDHRSAAATL
jgi:hypothetical protein